MSICRKEDERGPIVNTKDDAMKQLGIETVGRNDTGSSIKVAIN